MTKKERYTCYIFGTALWLISTTLTCALFYKLSGENLFSKFILVSLALTFEATKVLTFRMGGKAKVISYTLISISIFASFGSALQTIEEDKARNTLLNISSIESSAEYIGYTSEIESIELEIITKINRLSTLPTDFTTAAEKLTNSIRELRTKKESILTKRSAIKAEVKTGMFDLVAKFFKIQPETIQLVLLMVLAISIEAGAVTLLSVKKLQTQNSTGKEVGQVLSTPIACPIGSEEFLKAAMVDANLPFLNGRDKTAEKLGITCFDAKKLVKELIESGKIKVEGKRLKLI